MDVDGQSSAKRRLIMPSGELDRGSTGQALELVEADKINAHRYVHSLPERGCLLQTGKSIDMFISDAMINQASSVHNCMRSAETASGSKTKLEKFQSTTITLRFYGIDYKAEPTDLMAARKAAVEIVMGPGNTLNQKAMGNVQTIFALWQLWGERIEEVIYGSDYKIRTKRSAAGGPELIKATRFGLDPASRNYWSGLMWSLPVQSALCQSMGPLAVAIRLSNSTNDKYGAKWRTTFQRHFSFLPYAQDIAKTLQDNPPSSANNKEILGLISKLVCVTGARDVQRVAFPPVFLYEYLNTAEGMKTIDFSGHGAFLAYKAFCTKQYLAPKTNSPTHLQLAALNEKELFVGDLGTIVSDFAFDYKTSSYMKKPITSVWGRRGVDPKEAGTTTICMVDVPNTKTRCGFSYLGVQMRKGTQKYPFRINVAELESFIASLTSVKAAYDKANPKPST